ncbi:MAG: MCE family protein [Lewinella sp.]|nr:MCE family protein [Lewinella sp.]
MRKETSYTIRLGIFVIIGLLLFTFAVYSIGNMNSLFQSSFRLNALFENVNGLQPGNNVRYAGINVGSVEDIRIVDDSTVQVVMRVGNELLGVVKRDAVASIGSSGLVGSMLINISPGAGRAQPVVDNDFLRSYSRLETDDMMDALGNTSENLAVLTLELLKTIEKINSGYGTIPVLLRDSTLADDLRLTMRNVNIATNHLRGLTAHLERTSVAITQGEGLVNTLLYDTTLSQDLAHFTAGLDTVLAGTEPIFTQLSTASEDLAASSAELRTFLASIEGSDGLVNTMLHDTLAADDLRQTLDNLEEGSDLLNENLKAMRENFLFRRYFRKQERAERREDEQ